MRAICCLYGMVVFVAVTGKGTRSLIGISLRHFSSLAATRTPSTWSTMSSGRVHGMFCIREKAENLRKIGVDHASVLMFAADSMA